MIIKRAYAQTGVIPVELLQPGDTVKTAGALPAVQSVLDSLRADPAYIFALVNAMGFSEFYGPNSNTDWYGYNEHLGTNGLLHAWDGIGADVELDRVKGKTWTYGYPCFYNATVYAHHKNTDPKGLGFGDVRYVFANPYMKRVELLTRINVAEAKAKGHFKLLERAAGGERCDVSMGAKVPYDLATCCADWDAVRKAMKTFDPKRHAHAGIAVLEYHKKVHPIRGLAPTPKDYCRCFRMQRGRILPNGKKIFLYNDYPRFFDISIVDVGADKTARVYWFLGHPGEPVPTVTAKPSAPPSLFEHFGLKKVASINKEVPGVIEAVLADEAGTPDVGFEKMVPKGSVEGVRELLSSAAALGILATPSEFTKLVARTLPDTEAQKLRGFDPACGGIDRSFDVDSEKVRDRLLQALSPLLGTRSSFAPFMSTRSPGTLRIQLQISTDSGSEKLAAMYNGYRLSVLEKLGSLAPLAEGELIGFSLEKKAGSLSGLLLGAAPLLHLVASHLRKDRDNGEDLGVMAQFLADHPTFASLALVGAAVRLAMIKQGGGVLSGLASVLAPA